MAITNSNDISIVLSGGTTNINVNNSLGGNPSSSPVINAVLNNLFDDVAPKETSDGHEDYRCIYFFNDGDTPIFLGDLWITSDFLGGSTIELGVEQRDETQRITLDNSPVTGGSFDLSFDGIEFTSDYNSDIGIWATTLQSTLNALLKDGESLLQDVVVNAQPVSVNRLIFDVNFNGNDGSKNQPKFLLVADNLVPAAVDIFISVPQEGAPVNTIAAEIGLETTPPGGVGFFAPTEQSPISIPRLNPEDGFPLWIKRTTPAGSSPSEQDGFSLRFAAETLEPPAAE
jgi:hypothetical protein